MPVNARHGLAGIRVLIVDRSSIMSRLVEDALSKDPGITVVGRSDGNDAIERIFAHRPQVLILGIDDNATYGIELLRRVVAQTPLPTIVFGNMEHSIHAMQALELGAIDFVARPLSPNSTDFPRTGSALVAKVKLATRVNVSEMVKYLTGARPRPADRSRAQAVSSPSADPPARVVVAIAASTGGPKALDTLVSTLPANLPATLLIVQHMPGGFTASFAERLDRLSYLSIREAIDGEPLRAGEALVGPGGHHILLRAGPGGGEPVIHLNDSPPVVGLRPAANLLFESVAELFGSRAIGVVMTGMGSDGAEGLCKIKEAGGYTLAQDEESSVIYGMPKAAAETGCVDAILPLSDLAGGIIDAVYQRAPAQDSTT